MSKTNLSLVKPICKKIGCPLKGSAHDRCHGHRRDKTPCLGYPMHGQQVCRMHGGMAPNARRNATQRLALQDMHQRASHIVAFDDGFDESLEDGLLREVRWSAQVALALGDLCKSLGDGDLLSTSTQGSHLNVFMEAWRDERITHAKLTKMALDAGIAQRSLDLIEGQANFIVHAMVTLLTSPRLGLNSEQVIEGRVVAAEILRTRALDD